MAGKLDNNLRSGHKGEDLGILFLRNFCAVAHVRQEDDAGIDAIATLLKKTKRTLYAENTFFVQVKTASVPNISYEKEDIDWFILQDLPLFICTVDKEEDVIKIFTTNPGYQIIAYKGISKLQLNFTEEEQEYFKRHEKIGDTLIVDIGPPIIISGYRESNSKEERERLYMIMKIWAEEEHKQTQLRKIGFSMLARWESGGSPDYYAKIVTGNTNNVLRDLLAAKPFLEYLSNQIEWNTDIEEYKKEIMRGFKTWFKEYGIEISLNVDKKVLHWDKNQQLYTD